MTTPMKDNQGKLQLPWKLHVILEDPKYASIIAWTSNGDTFRILSKKDFTEIIMPSFFSSTSYKSFQRSLNLWGFRVVSSGHHKGECAHPLFKRGQPDLCMSMKRIKNQGTRKRKPSTRTATKEVSNNNKIEKTYPATTNAMLALRQTGVDAPMPFWSKNVSPTAVPKQDISTLTPLLFGNTTTSGVAVPRRQIMSPILLNAIEWALLQRQQQQQDRERIFQAAALVVAGHVLASSKTITE